MEVSVSPTRIIYIRHAEKPEKGGDSGATANGAPDSKSLTPRGWQRAGALVRYFCPLPPLSLIESMTPRTIFAADVDADDPSMRPIETVTPLFEYLQTQGPVDFITSYEKTDHDGLTQDLLRREGVVLVAWEHKQIPALIACIPGAPATPGSWPDDRFDMCWILDRTANGWSFSQKPQLLLVNDTSMLIS
jgi:broad specificity phosphatase PhoE